MRPEAPRSLAGEPALFVCLGRELTEVGRARAAAGEALAGWGLDEHADVTLVIVSELVTNASAP